MTTIMPQCFRCVHFNRGDKSKEFTCKAFPEGIPEDIIYNKFFHDKHYPNDNGILYEVDPKFEQQKSKSKYPTF